MIPSISRPGTAALLVIRAPLCYLIHGLNMLSWRFGLPLGAAAIK
jgi:hypothetical protein